MNINKLLEIAEDFFKIIHPNFYKINQILCLFCTYCTYSFYIYYINTL